MWQLILDFFKKLFAQKPVVKEEIPKESIKELPWIKIAKQEIGQKEIEGVQDNPRIVEYHKATDLSADDDETAWCSSFVNWVFMKCTLQRTHDAMARSWVNWGLPLDRPTQGCVVVFWRGAKDGDEGHVGFFMGFDSNGDILTLGGNEDNQVKIKSYPVDHVLAYRWPKDYTEKKDKQPEIKDNASSPLFPLSWEKNHPERIYWSKYLYQVVIENLLYLDQAKDADRFYPYYLKHSVQERATIWCELFSALAFYECAWNPGSASQDVGTEDRDTWSIGLLQLSVVDQQSYKLYLGLDYKALLEPKNNLHLGVLIMAKQIRDHGKINIPTGDRGLYWATLHDGGKYDQTDAIVRMVQRLKFN